MSIQVICPGCRASFRAKEEWAGRHTKCPKCGGPIVIAAELPVPAVVQPAPTSSAKSPADFSTFAVATVASAKPKSAVAPAAAKPSTPVVTEGRGNRRVTSLAAAIGSVAVVASIGGWWLLRRGDESIALGEPKANAAVSPVATASPTAPFKFFQANEPTKKPSATGTIPAANTAETVTAEPTLEDVVDRLKSSVVLISLYDTRGETIGVGSGFRIDARRNRFVTNYHVIKGGAGARVRYSNGLESTITGLHAVDEARDLAIFSTISPPPDCVALPLAADAVLRPGTKVIAVGHPRGLDYSVSDGIVSALRKTSELPEDAREFLNAPSDQQWIQTTAAISGGNSGGPLALPDGRVIGINTWTADGENLGFAAHVRHIQELMQQAEGAQVLTIGLYNQNHGGLAGTAAKEKTDFESSYAQLIRLGEAAEWRPSNDDNREIIQCTAGGAAFSNPRKLAVRELDDLRTKLAARNWNFYRHVKPLNEFAIDIFTNRPGPVMFFGKVVKTFSETHICRVQLLGRGYFVDVYEFTDPKKHRALGEVLIVMGMRPPGLETSPQRVAAGVVVPTRLPTAEDTALGELRDFVHFETDCPERQSLAADPKRKFPQIKFAAEAEPRTVYTVLLNGTGQGFDAVRLPASAGKADDDLIWAVTAPSEQIVSWGVSSLDGIIPTGVERFLTVEDYQPPNLALPQQNETLITYLSGQELKDSKRHLLWFEFSGVPPVEVKITGVYRSRSISRPPKSQWFTALGLPEVDGEEVKRKQQIFSTEPWSPKVGSEADDSAVTGEPFRAAE